MSTPAERLRVLGKLGPYNVALKELVPSTPREADPAAVRAWAADAGIDVSPKGRVPASVVEAYMDAHREPS